MSALTGAVIAPHKKIDNRTAQIVVSGPAFQWSEPISPDSLPYRAVADFNDRARKYTNDPHQVELAVMVDAHDAEQAATVRELAKVERKLASLEVWSVADRAAIDKLTGKAQAAAVAGKDSRAGRKDAASDLRRRSISTRTEKVAPLRETRRGLAARLADEDAHVAASRRQDAAQLRSNGAIDAALVCETFVVSMSQRAERRTAESAEAEQRLDAQGRTNAAYAAETSSEAGPVAWMHDIELDALTRSHRAAQEQLHRDTARIEKQLAALLQQNEQDRKAIDELLREATAAAAAGKQARRSRAEANVGQRRCELARRRDDQIASLQQQRQKLAERVNGLDAALVNELNAELVQLRSDGDLAGVDARRAVIEQTERHLTLRANRLSAASRDLDADAALTTSYLLFRPTELAALGAEASDDIQLNSTRTPSEMTTCHEAEFAREVTELVARETAAAALRAAGKAIRADAAFAEATRLRKKLAGRFGENVLPPAVEGSAPVKLSWSNLVDQNDEKEIARLTVKASEARATGSTGKAGRLDDRIAALRANINRRAEKRGMRA